MLAVIHSNPRIRWHVDFTNRMAAGLTALGVNHQITTSRQRISEHLAILLGTTSFRAVEQDGPFLLVDRCSFGDTSKWVTLVRDGHGRRGDFRASMGVSPHRWEKYKVPVREWRTGRKTVLCGQSESWSPHYSDLRQWYKRVTATHFRRHPAGDNPTGLPEYRCWDDVRCAITLNSSVAVDAILAGVPTITMDEAAMAWDVTGHEPCDIRTPLRDEWLHWLAWTQWTHDEISEGEPWAHLL